MVTNDYNCSVGEAKRNPPFFADVFVTSCRVGEAKRNPPFFADVFVTAQVKRFFVFLPLEEKIARLSSRWPIIYNKKQKQNKK